MKFRSIALFIMIVLFTANLFAVEFFISPDGNDKWSGTLKKPNAPKNDGPFATLQRARDAVRKVRKQSASLDADITVSLRKGMYHVSKTFMLAKQDSGTENSRTVYQAYADESVTLTGGKEITGWTKVTDKKILDRLEANAISHILQADLKACGIIDYGKLTTRGFGRPVSAAALELFCDNKPMQLARYPNQGWLNIKSVPNGKDGGMFTYKGDRPKRWGNSDDIWVHGYWTQDWADSYESVERIDTENRQIWTRSPHGVYGYKTDARYYVLNILDELDAPGEWQLDRKTGTIYFWPPEGDAASKTYVSMTDTIISMDDVSYVTIAGMTLKNCRANAIDIRSGQHDLIAGCHLQSIGNRAVTISGGSGNGVVSCDIHHTGDGGITINGGDRQTLTPANHYVDNNHIYAYDRWCRTYRPAVMVAGVGNKVSHNRIHDAPHNGIQLGGNDHIIEFNEIYDICKETGDVGAFYMGRDWTQRGTVIRHNYFHDIHGPYTHGAMAVYLDDAASGITIFGNVFYKASRAAFIGGGHDNIVDNNIFIDCYPSVHIDARALGWAKKYAVKSGSWNMYEKLEKVNYKKPPYSDRYPALAKILDNDPAIPAGNIVRNNVSFKGRWIDLQGVKKEWVKFGSNFVDSDPGFADIANGDLTLRSDSKVFKKLPGFKKIPFREIGLYKDKYRKNIGKKE
ncbi:MAG: right-handed parallel beta-helix repeat-containing protein [Anaerohalosphaera sp.]|nr:right-handed parallel beta-helix repeat-containing protein [Anaerohalosphaera sp.]